MALKSAGILLYRISEQGAEVLLVHPGGPFFSRKDAGSWSIPKGLLEEGEDGLETALREFREELGVDVPATAFTPLPEIKQKGGKIVIAWTACGDLNATNIKSNLFQMEYPPKSGIWREYPEVDRAEWFTMGIAKEKILPAQTPFLTALGQMLSAG
jgi:predicted NUDIX family NTP pyrophosphohydrolase